MFNMNIFLYPFLKKILLPIAFSFVIEVTPIKYLYYPAIIAYYTFL